MKRINDDKYCANVADPVIKQYVVMVNKASNKLAEFARDNNIDLEDALSHANGNNYSIFSLFKALASCKK